MESARRTERQKRDAIESACDLIDITYRHARKLLGTNSRYFSVQEALELAEREFVGRATHDNDTMAEWRLRRRMFADADAPLMAEIQGQSYASLRLEEIYAPAS
jgi:hypothetical protein